MKQIAVLLFAALALVFSIWALAVSSFDRGYAVAKAECAGDFKRGYYAGLEAAERFNDATTKKRD